MRVCTSRCSPSHTCDASSNAYLGSHTWLGGSQPQASCTLLSPMQEPFCATACSSDSDCGAPGSGYVCTLAEKICARHPEEVEDGQFRATQGGSLPTFTISASIGVPTPESAGFTSTTATGAGIGVPTAESGASPAILPPSANVPTSGGVGAVTAEQPQSRALPTGIVGSAQVEGDLNKVLQTIGEQVREIPNHGTMSFDMFWREIKTDPYGSPWASVEAAKATFLAYPDPVQFSIFF